MLSQLLKAIRGAKSKTQAKSDASAARNAVRKNERMVGEKEQAEGIVSVRKKGDGDVGSMTLDAFIAMAQEEIQSLTYEK